jgi:hypothetical protein
MKEEIDALEKPTELEVCCRYLIVESLISQHSPYFTATRRPHECVS